MGLPYPGGPHIDKLSKQGNNKAFVLSKPQIADYNYSFSGLKTSFLYLVRDKEKENPQFIEQNRNDLAASLQTTIVTILMKKLIKAAKDLNINEIALAGGVAANSELRHTLLQTGKQLKWNTYIPPIAFTTDNAAMIAINGYLKYLHNDFSTLGAVPFARNEI